MLRVLFIVFGIFLAAPASAQTPLWTVDENHSTLSFVFQQEGESFRGSFQKFNADIRFEEENLAQSSAHIEIDLTSLSAGNAERDDALQSSDWFYLSKFPKAVFKTTGFRHMEGVHYEADAVLSIRGVERAVVLPFTLDFEGSTVHMLGALDLRRLDFNLGEGFWANPDFIGLSVMVEVEILARRASLGADE